MVSGQYTKYITEGTRFRELFSSAPKASMTEMMDEGSNYPGPVWRFACSLRQENAARLAVAHCGSSGGAGRGCEVLLNQSAGAWRSALRSAIRVMDWSADRQQDCLTERGIKAMCPSSPTTSSVMNRSPFTGRKIFPDRRLSQRRGILCANCSARWTPLSVMTWSSRR